MIEIHKYIADDGTEFDNEYDCVIYERNLAAKAFNNKIVALSASGKRMNLISDLEYHAYLYIANEEAYEFYNELCEDHNCNYLDTYTHYGFFYYDTSQEEWINIDNWIDALIEYKNMILEALDTIMANGEEIEC